MTDLTPDTISELRSRCDGIEAMGHPHIMLDVRTTRALLDRVEAAERVATEMEESMVNREAPRRYAWAALLRGKENEA